MIIRDATEADVDALTAIYNDVIASTDAIWLDDPVTRSDRMSWLHAQLVDRWPVLVADIGGTIAGYGAYGPFREKSGYWPTVEHTIHIERSHRGTGVGTALLEALVAHALGQGKHQMVAAIDAGNTGSIRFHERHGFRVVGELAGVGRKDRRSVDLVLMQRALRAEELETAELKERDG